ncbi:MULTISPECIES: benzaldehyde dehydrogenase [unclassified Arthrobacter]|uniref:benzaldehyde dehydrogenase n=1 Tax=unclassified Arthrobacter TaxID=235627 RepID=UPI002107345E|nr:MULTISPECIES: benzaldehyde dehydrogenase [unclassified Arthrobacter]MCQ1985902.1 benzaldehyde dehydrogenase [Arthrobacter sp. zg-Y844]MCQ1994356.1 benzaldehyde dehydrogenase [Arthrobacter sp. zg-Y1171]UWX81553.1 benzaldehyde dehydrogenase [Arthrobacter sp. zg-Y1171]
MSILATSAWHGKIHTDSWTAGSGGVIDVVEPSTGLVLGAVGAADRADALAAATRAAAAQQAWAQTKPEERAAVLRRAGMLFEDHAKEIQGWIIRETGGIEAKAALETHIAANECFEAAALPAHPAGEVLTSNENRWSFARRRAAGVVSVISPFNFPLILSIRSVAPALALGNAVLLKPDPRTSVSGGVSIMRIFELAGLPAGVLQLLPGGADVGQALVEAPEVRIISFTGSTAAGRKVGETAGRLLKRAHLELGGNNALIVLPGADIELAASAGAFGSFMHQGQICMTTGRHLVHESLLEEYIDRLSAKARALPVGDPHTGSVALGPIIDERQRDNIDRLVRAAKDAGARIAAGGNYEGLFYQPTVLTELTPDNPAWTEEIFGPVAPVLGFSTVDEAVELANASEYGLSVGVLGEVGLAMEVADRMISGKVHINEQTVSDEANSPFGGMGASGTGSRFGGAGANIEAFTETQWLTMRPGIAGYPF